MSETILKPRSRTDWERVRNMKDEDIDLSDSPELDEEFFANARVREPTPGPHSFRTFRIDPQSGEEITTGEWTSDEVPPVNSPAILTLPIEPETLAWFRAQGDDADDKMRAALRIYAQSHKK